MNQLCEICPRKCKINRKTTKGFCSANNKIQIDKIMVHYWEEPCICGTKGSKQFGSGNIFFSGCNLKCVYCQNYDISHTCSGQTYSIKQLVEIFKDLEKQKVTNINLVTPTHYTKQIVSALKIYQPKIPICWNSSGYENPETIKKVTKHVKIFLLDFKYCSNNLAQKYSHCSNYFENVTETLKILRNIFPKDKFYKGIMKEGILIRHMILPTHYEDSIKILHWINENLTNKTRISLLSQYTPYGETMNYPEINRKLKPVEYKKVVAEANKLGFQTAYIQYLESANTTYIPNFKK